MQYGYYCNENTIIMERSIWYRDTGRDTKIVTKSPDCLWNNQGFLNVERTGIEPVIPPWKGGVLTPWPTLRFRNWSAKIAASLISAKSFCKYPVIISVLIFFMMHKHLKYKSATQQKMRIEQKLIAKIYPYKSHHSL